MTLVEIIFKILRIWSIFAAYTLLFSVLLSCSSYRIFEKAGKKRWQSFIPVYNLIIMLDIVKLSKFYFLLLLFLVNKKIPPITIRITTLIII